MLQCFYVNATRNALLEYGRHPEDESTLSMLHDMHQKASAALEAATQLPAVNPEDLEMWHRIMCTTVRPASGIYHLPSCPPRQTQLYDVSS